MTLADFVERFRDCLARAAQHLADFLHRYDAELRQLVTASTPAGSSLVIAAAPGDLGVDVEARTIRGMVVPFGSAGHTSGGRLTFAAGSLRISDPKRVKLLREHDQRDVLGFAVELVEHDGSDGRPAGLYGTFSVPEGDNGDRALAEASNGLRDAFSVGVQLDDATLTRLHRSQGAPVAAAGQLREVSQVSVPAFDDARIAATTGALVVSAWSSTDETTATATSSPAGAAGTNREGRNMTEAQRRRFAELFVKASLTPAEQGELAQLQQLAMAGQSLGTVEHPAGQPAGNGNGNGDQGAGDQGNGGTGQPATAPAGTATASAPAVVPAVAGAARVTGEPSTYNFDGTDSLVRDAYMARMDGDTEAAARVRRFNAELSAGNAASVAALAQAAATTSDVDGAGTDVPSAFLPTSSRPDLMRQLIDQGRPIISRLTTTPIRNAAPFAIPSVGEFDGVADHVEGQPHAPAGTLTLGGDTVQPTSVSGAWEVSRELVDSGNPAIDRIALRAMLRDYRRKSEGKVVALINARAAQAGLANAYGVSTALAMRGAMLDFVNDDDEGADLALLSKGLLRMLGLDVDTTERPQLPFVNPTNSVGAMRAGATGLSIDGAELVRAARLDAGVTGANTAGSVGVLMRREGVLWCESPVAQFRFDEVLGPGVIKLALWAYNGTAILDTDDVQVLNSGADPTP